MARYRLDSIASLARQLMFTPLEKRQTQLGAAEELLLELDPTKAYPLDFVINRITGYVPKRAAVDLLTGLALQHDLGMLVEQVSESLSLRAEALREPVLSIEDVCQRFGVTSKTIQRWRRRGLPARRMMFADGKVRVAFLLHVVERFFAQQREQSASVRPEFLSEAEQAVLVRHARRLAACGCSEGEMARRIGRRLGRSPAAIVFALRKRDAALAAQAGKALSVDQQQQIIRGHERKLGLGEICGEMGIRRAAAYEVLLAEKIAGIKRRKVRFIDDPLYQQADAARLIEEIIRQEPIGQGAEETVRVPRGLPAGLSELWREPLLTAAQERGLFLKLHYHKRQFVMGRRRLDPELARWRDLHKLEQQRQEAVVVRNAIVRANLRLVVSVARRHLRPGLDLMELLSEGSVTLIRAVESFDVHKGTRFSTYGTLALVKGFARCVPEMQMRGRMAHPDVELLQQVADARWESAERQLMHRQELQRLLSRLSLGERQVVSDRFGLDGGEPASFDQLSRRMGVSLARVRALARDAMMKLRGQ